MCVIIVKDHDKVLNKMDFVRAEEINPDGLGIVWLDTGEVIHTDSKNWQQLVTKRPFIAHFRYATVGAVTPENTHPYYIDGKNEWFMMNGTVPGMGDANCSDTRELSYRLSDMPKKSWASYLKKWPTVRFLTYNEKTKKYRILNKNQWSKIDGTWYSKTNILDSIRIAVYGTLKPGGGNYYSYLYGESTNIGHGKTVDQYPMVIQGLPYVVEAPGKGHNIDVNVFNVSPDVLERIDGLEGHPSWYYRKKVDVKIGLSGRIVSCWMYFNNYKGWEDLPWHGSYEVYDRYGSYGGYGSYGSYGGYGSYGSYGKKKPYSYDGWELDEEGMWVRCKPAKYEAVQSGLYDNVFRIMTNDHERTVEDIIEVNFDSGAYVSLSNRDLKDFGICIGDILIEYGEVDPAEANFMVSNGMADSRRKLQRMKSGTGLPKIITTDPEVFDSKYTAGEKASDELSDWLDELSEGYPVD
jgi:gamma-glutamylaminecyclotransferase